MHKCGFIALLGQPNAGKSTLLNQLVGEKVSIVTHKVQTTRCRIHGIALQGDAQLIFIDTPGIFQNPKRRLEKAMVQEAWQTSQQADTILVLVDVSQKSLEGTHHLLNKLGSQPFILVLNKIDRLKRENLLKIAESFAVYPTLMRTFMISALRGDGVEDLKNFLADRVPEGPWLYPESQVSDVPKYLWASEITREKIMLNLHQEVPYESMVETDQWETLADESIKIHQTIYVARPGQKALILGKGGQTIKRIGQGARLEIMAALNQTVHLLLHVKVVENWPEKRAFYEKMGFHSLIG
jgi:GTP-binding protein Era